MKHVFRGLATLLGVFLTIGYSAQAQTANDALLYMRQNPSGTARTLGLAGANVSLGADFGNLTSNPAGLGFYTKSEVTLTPGVGFGTDKARQIANSAVSGNQFSSLSQNANSFHITSAGVVFANRRLDSDQSSEWRGGAFALGFTRLADFNQSFRYQSTTDDNHSYFQRLREPYGNSDYASQSYQSAADDIYNQYRNNNQGSQYINADGLAFGTGLVYQYIVPRPGGTPGDSIYQLGTLQRDTARNAIHQQEIIKSTGSLSQFDLGYGGNYRDKLYIGGGVGIVSLNRTRTATFSESSANGTTDSQDFISQDYFKTTGTGINARLGFIYKAADEFRLGASIQTPTYIQLTDIYNTTLTANPLYTSNAFIQATPSLTTIPGRYEYSITTPFRANGGATVLLNKYGFLTADVEYVGYSSAKFNTTDDSSDATIDFANYNISNNYRNVFNFRVGAEGRFDILRARLGYAYYSDPYKSSSYDRAQQYFTAGVGVRTKQFFVDLAGVYLHAKDQYQPYSLATQESPTINITNNRFTASLTGGLIF